jgi:hypothetical protein
MHALDNLQLLLAAITPCMVIADQSSGLLFLYIQVLFSLFDIIASSKGTKRLRLNTPGLGVISPGLGK